MKTRTLKKIVLAAAAFAVTTLVAPSFAAHTETTQAENAKVDDFVVGKKAIDDKNWQKAVDSFTKVVANDPKNADAFNLLGFANRWLNRYPEAFAAYGKALALDPAHKGALHYSGIAYLKSGQRDKADAQLERLKSVCANCEETQQLSKALVEASSGVNTAAK
jgi:Flp pilus assembly protein TadD